jgi:hypothetical protein
MLSNCPWTNKAEASRALSCACNMASIHGRTKDNCPTSPHAVPSGSHWLHGQAFLVYLAVSAQAQSRDDTSGVP